MDTVLTTSSFESIKLYNNPDIKRSVNHASIIAAIVILIVGISMFLITFLFDKTQNVIISTLVLVGIALVIYSVFRLIWRSKAIVYLPTKAIIKEDDFYFDSKYFQMLNSVATSGNCDLISQLQSQSGGNCKLITLYSDDKQFIALQVFKYIPFNYMPCDEVYYFKGKTAENLINAIKTAKQTNLKN